MLVLFIACLCIAAWGFNSVVIQVAKQRPREQLFSLRNRYDVDEYIWDEKAPRSLRRRYVLCMACVPLGLLCLARFIWTNETAPDHKLIGVSLAGLFALIVAVSLTRKALRYGI